MIRINYSDYRRGQAIYVTGFTDTYIVDNENRLAMISIVGYDSAVRAIVGALHKNRTITCEPSETLISHGRYRSFTTRLGSTNDALTHAIVMSTAALDEVSEAPLVLAWDGNVTQTAYNVLYNSFSTPMLPEWAPIIFGELQEIGKVQPLQTYSATNQTLQAFRLNVDQEEFNNLVSTMVQTGQLIIPDGTEDTSAIMAEVSNVTEYMHTFGPLLANRVTQLCRPMYNPMTDELNPNIYVGPRTPFPAQADVIQAVVKTLEKKSGVIIVGEMGTGKTYQGIKAVHISAQKKPYRALVMCPGHIVHKWAREIKQTIPGAKTHILENWKDVIALRHLPRKSSGAEYYIISRDRAKLSFIERPAATWNKRKGGWICPDCGALQIDNEDNPLERKDFNKKVNKNKKCCECDTPLWTADPEPMKPLAERPGSTWVCQHCNEFLYDLHGWPLSSFTDFDQPNRHNQQCPHCYSSLWKQTKGYRRVAPVQLFKQYLRNFIDYFIPDELHELKGESAQGNVLGVMAGLARRTVGLTGTLLNGYASSLFYLLFRLNTRSILESGLTYQDLQKWVSRYGVLERKFKIDQDNIESNSASRGYKGGIRVKELAGVNPQLYTQHMLEICVFIGLGDISDELPPYEDTVVLVEPDPELKEAYEYLKDTLKAIIDMQLATGNSKLLGAYLNSLMSYPDIPFGNKPIVDPSTDEIVVVPRELSKHEIYAKEAALLEIIQDEYSQNRKVYVYTHYQNVNGRLLQVVQQAGYKAAVLTSAVPPVKREAWINKKVSEGVDVIIGNTALTATGLDLYDFPSLVFYGISFNLYTILQGSRRSWRIGQTKDVRVYFLAYKDTIQQHALILMATKAKAAQALEGKFSAEGLVAIAQDGNIAMKLAEMVSQGLGNVAESIESVWGQMGNRERAISAIAANIQSAETSQQPAKGSHNDQITFDLFNNNRCNVTVKVYSVDKTSKKKKGPLAGQLGWELDVG